VEEDLTRRAATARRPFRPQTQPLTACGRPWRPSRIAAVRWQLPSAFFCAVCHLGLLAPSPGAALGWEPDGRAESWLVQARTALFDLPQRPSSGRGRACPAMSSSCESKPFGASPASIFSEERHRACARYPTERPLNRAHQPARCQSGPPPATLWEPAKSGVLMSSLASFAVLSHSLPGFVSATACSPRPWPPPEDRLGSHHI
jgi:hypothetical protein